SLSRNRANVQFSAWLRRSLASADIVVGRCTIVTAVSTLLRRWPPGPDRRVRRTSQSASNSSTGSAAGWIAAVTKSAFKKSSPCPPGLLEQFADADLESRQHGASEECLMVGKPLSGAPFFKHMHLSGVRVEDPHQRHAPVQPAGDALVDPSPP